MPTRLLIVLDINRYDNVDSMQKKKLDNNTPKWPNKQLKVYSHLVLSCGQVVFYRPLLQKTWLYKLTLLPPNLCGGGGGMTITSMFAPSILRHLW